MLKQDQKLVGEIDRKDLYASRKPGGRALYRWCYGNRYHAPHPCPEDELTDGDGTRCAQAEPDFEAATAAAEQARVWVVGEERAKIVKVDF